MSTPSPTDTNPQSKTKPKTKSTFTLLLFASAQSYCDNTESLSLPAPTTLREVYEELERRWPGVGEKVLRSSQVALNLEYIDADWEVVMRGEKVGVKVGDEVGIIPPVSAG